MQSLVERHRAIDRRIAAYSQSPAFPQARLRALKRLRLALKDRIAATRRQVESA